MKKTLAFLTVIFILAISTSASAYPLTLQTFIWEGETLAEVSDGLSNGTIAETSYYNEWDASNTNSTRLGCFFDIQNTDELFRMDFYMDFSYTYSGTEYVLNNHTNFSSQTEFYDGSWKMFHLPAFGGDTSFLSQVEWTGYSGDDFGSATLFQGEEPAQNPVPEPSTMILFGIGLLGLASAGRRKTN